MSETYTKLFGSITLSTIWTEDSETRIVWITMLALADRVGYVGASLPGLAASARVSVEDTKAALDKFLAPDPHSRSSEYEGRRIAVADRGWTLLNYERFRDMRDEEARKEWDRNRKREQRARQKDAKDVPDKSAMSQNVPQKSISHKHRHKQTQNKSAHTETPFDLWWAVYPRKVGKGAARKAYKKATACGNIVVGVLFQTTKLYRTATDAWQAEDRKYIPYPATWLNREHFHDDPAEWVDAKQVAAQQQRKNEALTARRSAEFSAAEKALVAEMQTPEYQRKKRESFEKVRREAKA